MAIYKRDIANINLETGNIHRTFLNHSIGMKDQKADHFGVRVFRDGEPVSLTGVSVQGVFMPPQGSPIAITSGNIVSGNVAEVVLPQACYNYDGQFTLAIKLVDSSNSVTGTVRIVDGMVDNTHASGTVAPTSAVPTYQEVLATYDQAIAAVNTVNTIARNMQIDITASAVSDSNNSYRDLGNRWMTFKRGYYSTPAVGSVSTYTGDSDYIFSIVSCLAGEIVHAHSYGGSSTIAAWAFLDSDMKVVSRGGSGDFNGTRTAPTGSVYVLLNVKLASIGSASYYGYVGNEATKDKISDLKSALNTTDAQFASINGVIVPPNFEIGLRYVDNGSEVFVNNTKRMSFKQSKYIKLKQGDIVSIDNDIIYVYGGGYSTNNGTSFTPIASQQGNYTAPADGIYFFWLYKVGEATFTADDIKKGWTYIHFTRNGSILKTLETEFPIVKSEVADYSNVEFTESSGYFGSDGSIQTASSSSQEKYTNRLSVNPSDKLKITIDFTSSVGIWVAYVSYTKKNQFISRTVIGNTNGSYFENTVTVPNGVAYIAFCYRTWGTSTESIAYYSSVYEIAKSANQAANIIEPSHNLFSGQFSGLGNFEYVNGRLKNTATDTYSDFHFITQFRSGGTNVDVSTVTEVNFVGRIRATVTASGNGDNITIVHNGRSKNFAAIIPFSFTSGKTYTISLNVEGYDVQSVGGLVLSDIQIEENDTSTPYIPDDSAIDYIARGYINDAVTEKDLNILLMGDSIFGNDGEIALFLDQMCGKCVNGAFGGTQVSIRTDSSDAYKYFDGVNLITALCNQSWTEQDSAASSLSSTYPWITARLAGLKAVDMSDVDLLIMDWGTNDYTAGKTISDITTAYGQVIDLLQMTYPRLRILVTTPIWRYWGTESDNQNGDNKTYITNGPTLKEIALAIEQFANDKRISVLNAYQNLPLSYKTASTYYDSGDTTHLNTFGNQVYAYLLHGKIRSIY